MKLPSTFLALLVLAAGCTSGNYPDGSSRHQSFSPDGIEFRITDVKWKPDRRGNQRAIISIKDDGAEAVVVNLPWRRPDLRIDTKKIIVCDQNDNEIKDVAVTLMTSAKGQLIFKPVKGSLTYYVYYLPYKFRPGHDDARYGKPWNDYLKPEYEADADWKAKALAAKSSLPEAKVQCFESASDYNFWGPMGLIATPEEENAIKDASGKDMIVFPEDRAFPIKLKNNLPCRWNKAPETYFSGLAMRNEYYVWQFGVWAAGKDLGNVRVQFSDLVNGKSVIPASEFTCFNQEGTSWDGTPLVFTIDVPKTKVQALWCGVQIPEDAKTGTYTGKATVTADGTEPQVIDLKIKVGADVLADRGESDLWRHARLRWLNSTIGLDNEPTAPFKEMNIEGNRIEATGKTVVIGGNGMLQSVNTHDKEVLSSPQTFVVSTSKGDVTFAADNLKIEKEAAGLVSWKASSEQNGIKFDLTANMEFDGNLHYEIRVSSDSEIDVKDIKLVTNYTDYVSEYYMGCGASGGYRPEYLSWDWTGPYDSYWIGSTLAGLHTEFRGGTYHGPLLNDYKPAPTPVWSNGGLGRVSVSGKKGQEAVVVASTGKNTICSTPKNFEFNLLITPVKELNPSKHFNERYCEGVSLEKFIKEAEEDGCNILISHVPFERDEKVIEQIKHEHECERLFKIYYTVREIHTKHEDLYPFFSLNHEILSGGVGYGLPWDCEHLIDDYKPAWYDSHEETGDDPSISIVLVAISRYINYWLECLRWIEETYDIDGLNMDDISFDRNTIKRVRRIIDRYHDGSLIDLHSNTGYSKGPANQYTEFFPYMDRLWFGESYRYDEMSPDQWFVTFSGIPFGVMSEMLQGGGNRFLGMVYGTTARHSWTDAWNEKCPAPVWKFWDKFGISDAKMVGYWDPDCAVTIDDPEVKATTYVKDDKVLVSVGNFAATDKTVRLNIDWKAFGMDPATVKIEAPEIENFQSQTAFNNLESLPVKSKEGWLIVISK